MRKHGDLKMLIRIEKGYDGLGDSYWACYFDMLDNIMNKHKYPQKEEDKNTGQPYYYQEYHHRLMDEALEKSKNYWVGKEEEL